MWAEMSRHLGEVATPKNMDHQTLVAWKDQEKKNQEEDQMNQWKGNENPDQGVKDQK